VLTYLSFCYLKLSAAPLNFQKYTGLAVWVELLQEVSTYT
jgi:hypothetical protein